MQRGRDFAALVRARRALIVLLAAAVCLTIPALATAEGQDSQRKAFASISDAEEEACVAEGMVPSQVLVAKMFGARKKKGTGWTLSFRFKTLPYSESCVDAGFNRYLNLQVQMQNKKKPRLWTSFIRFTGENGGLGFLTNDGGIGGPFIQNNVHETRDDYTCLPGKRKRKVRLQIMNSVKRDGSLVGGPSISPHRVTVYGAC